MEKIMTMGGVVDRQRPTQGLRDLQETGADGILLDFDLFAQVHSYGSETYRAERARQDYERFKRELSADMSVRIARTPFLNPLFKIKIADITAFLLRMNKECIHASEALGCRRVIVQPLYREIPKGKEWEANRAYYLELAKNCKEDTQLLLTNLCADQGGHLIRGICSDAVVAVQWLEELNREAGTERFGFCLDTGVCNLCGQDVQPMIQTLGTHLKAVLLSENDGIHAAKRLPFTGDGMDWLGVIRGLRQEHFDGQLILDVGDTMAPFSPLMKPALLGVCRSMLDYFVLQTDIENQLKKYRNIVLFGAGNMCRNYMKCYGDQYPPLYTCDNNPKLWGTTFEGLEVHNPQDLKNLPSDCGVIICNVYYREIEKQLRELGITNIGYFNDEYMPSFYYDRIEREE